MSAGQINPPPEDLAELFAVERPLDSVPAEISDRIFERLRRSLGFDGPGDRGGGKGSAGLGGAGVGGLLAIILGAGGTAYLVVAAVLRPTPAAMIVSSPKEATSTAVAETDDLAGRGAPVPTAARFPRFQNQGPTSSDFEAVTTGETVAIDPPTGQVSQPTPGWHGQRDVKPERVAGHVFDRGRPASGIEVLLEGVLSGADPAFGRRVFTNADGGFDFGPQAAWFYVVSAVAPGRRPGTARVRIGDPLATPRSDDLVLMLDDCVAGASGTVTDESGKGVPDARVRVLENSFNGTGVETDPNGGFHLCTRAGPIRLRVEAEGYGSVITPAVAASDFTRTDVRIASEAVIEGGTVREETGESIPGVQLTLWPLAGGARTLAAPASTISDSSGHFTFRGVAAGKYWLRAWAEDSIGRDDVAVDVKPGEIKRAVVRRLQKTSTVQVQVLSRGRPVVGASIALASRDADEESFVAITQIDGRATLHGVLRGDLSFRVPRYEVLSPKAIRVESDRVTGITVDVETRATPP